MYLVYLLLFIFVLVKLNGITIFNFSNFFSIAINFLLRKSIKYFSVSDISFYPFSLKGIKIITKRTRAQPEFEIKIGEILVLSDVIFIIKSLLGGKTFWLKRTPLTERILYIELSNLSIIAKNIRFRDFLDPPRGSKNEANSKLKKNIKPYKNLPFLSKLSRIITIVFKNVSFNFSMPLSDIKIYGGSKNIIISTGSSRSNELNSEMKIDLRGYYFRIDDDCKKAFAITLRENECYTELDNLNNPFSSQDTYLSADDYINNHGVELRMIITSELETKTTRVVMKMLQQHNIFCCVKPFLTFFDKYQMAEDDSIEMKLIKGLDVIGTMNYIGLVVYQDLFVELSDPLRCGDNLILKLVGIEAALTKKLFPGEVNMYSKFKKMMSGKVSLIEWVQFPNTFVRKAEGVVEKNIINVDNFIDVEEINGTCEIAQFPDVSNKARQHIIYTSFTSYDISSHLISSYFIPLFQI